MRTLALGLFYTFFLFFTLVSIHAQKSSINGIVTDIQTGLPIPYANVVLLHSDSTSGTITDLEGNFELADLKPGRYDIRISYLGYQESTIADIILQAHKSKSIEITLEETPFNLNEITIKPELDKKATKNELTAVSGRLLSVEEANRYAGGFDDPARLASAFAGVSSNIQSNGITIRGNAPKYFQWKMEGIEIPNPNHFSDLSVFGGGGLTALSSQVMDNADFLTGAMPAVYNNALSGVFDLGLRKGSIGQSEHHIQVGIIGIDLASEGPLLKNNKSSYIANYRYSTLGLVQPLLPAEAGEINYQDLSFKLSFPNLKKGTIEWWGLGLKDFSGNVAVSEVADRKYENDLEEQKVKQYMGATGIKYHKYFNNKYQQVLRSQIALTATGTDLKTRQVNDLNILTDKNAILNQQWNGHFLMELNSKPGKRHNNFTGLKWRSLHYNLQLNEVNTDGSLLEIVNDKGRSSITTFYSSSIFQISPNLSLIAGINSQYFALSKELLFEPRFSLSVQKNSQLKFSAGYGLHSRLEPLQYYFTTNNSSVLPNRNLKSSKAHHLVASVQWTPAKNYLLKIEPYYQFLFDIPVTEDHRLSFINLENDWFLNDRLLNTGMGRNLGIDFTLERYVNRGFYGLFTCSVFDSKFKTAQKNNWLNTRFNSHLLVNLLLGKEFNLGSNQNKKLGINYRIAYQGGAPYTPVLENASLSTGEIMFDHNQPFALQFPGAIVHHFTINYSISRPGTTHHISLKVLNAGSYKEFESFRINLISNQIEEYREALIIPNLSYKISF